MKLFYIAAFVIDGREKRPVSWFVFSKDDREACKHIAGKYSVGGLGRVSIISIEEIEPDWWGEIWITKLCYGIF